MPENADAFGRSRTLLKPHFGEARHFHPRAVARVLLLVIIGSKGDPAGAL
jgi:hypothetical protein